MTTISPDMRATIDAAHLCFAATVTAAGEPNLSPKGTIRVWDDQHLFFLDIASPTTRHNLLSNPYIELNVVEQLSRRGYRFFGRATLHRADDVHAEAVARVFAEEHAQYPVNCVVLIAVERASALISPGYAHCDSEAVMRREWRERRRELDERFERHIAEYSFDPSGTL